MLAKVMDKILRILRRYRYASKSTIKLPATLQEPSMTGNILRSFAMLACLLLNAHGQEKPAFAAPSSEQFAKLLEFSEPVNFTKTEYSEEKLKRLGGDWGPAIAAYRYADPAHTSRSYKVAVFPTGAVFGADRKKMEEWVAQHRTDATDVESIGTFKTADGRVIQQMPLGFGPGGSEYAAILQCKDQRYEIFISELTDSDIEVQNKGTPKPKRELREIIEAVEALIFR
jgi:hypothetical protein